jgi:tetratricopeptide (TPR) repeat protein
MLPCVETFICWNRKSRVLFLGFLFLTSTLLAQTSSSESLYNEAVKAYDSGDVPQAIRLYQDLLRREPGSVPTRTNLGVALVHEGRYDDAILEYREALRLDPKNAVVRLNLALAWYKQGDLAKASTELQRLHSQDQANLQVLQLLTDCYLRLGNYRETVVLLEPTYHSQPDNLAIDYALGTALIRNGETQRGEAVIDRILKNGNSAEAALLLGAAQYEAADYKSAADSIRKALDEKSSLPGGWTLYARALLGSGENDNAKSAFLHALQTDPNDFDANLHLGGMLRHDGDTAGAAPYVSRALKLRPHSPAAQFQVGALSLQTGNLEKARQELEPIARQWPDFVEVHVQLALLYARMNRPQDSAHERQIVLALNEKARKQGPQPER